MKITKDLLPWCFKAFKELPHNTDRFGHSKDKELLEDWAKVFNIILKENFGVKMPREKKPPTNKKRISAEIKMVLWEVECGATKLGDGLTIEGLKKLLTKKDLSELERVTREYRAKEVLKLLA